MLTELEHTAPGTTLGATLAATLAPTVTGPRGNGFGSRARAELPSFTQGKRFELIKPYAKGGIGQVWLARDRELQREVAVKEIQARYVDRAGLRARFLLEAEITGNLEHPGIVPVYSLGRNASGRPFYAMRFISCWQNPVHFRSWSTGNRPEPATTGTERLPPSGSAAASGITSPCRRNACASSDCACRESSCAAPWPPASCPPASATCSSYDVASWLSWFDPYPADRSTRRNKVRTVTGDPKELYYGVTVR